MGAAFSRDLTQAIAFKSSTSSDEANRSHNQKQQIQNYKVSFQIRLAVFLASGAAYMKLHQNGTDFMITLAALAAGLNSEPQNIE